MKLTLLGAVMLLAACADDTPASLDDTRDPTAGAEIAEDYNRTLEKAEAVEDTLESGKRRIDDALDE